MISAVDAQVIRQIQATVAEGAVEDLRQLFSMAVGLDPVQGRDLLLEVTPALVQTHGEIAAAAAGEWYDDLRAREIGSGMAPTLAAPVTPDRVEKAVRFSAQHLFTVTPEEMLGFMAGSLTKWIVETASETVIATTDADPEAVGWQRVARPGACDFCQMLAGRGAVYKRRSVDFAAHSNCNCGAAPEWDKGAKEVDVRAYEASERMQKVRNRAADPSDPKKQAEAQEVLDRHSQRTREWIAANRD